MKEEKANKFNHFKEGHDKREHEREDYANKLNAKAQKRELKVKELLDEKNTYQLSVKQKQELQIKKVMD